MPLKLLAATGRHAPGVWPDRPNASAVSSPTPLDEPLTSKRAQALPH
jgi:hypothetical protein